MTSEGLPTQQERAIVRELVELVSYRGQAEQRIKAAHASSRESADSEQARESAQAQARTKADRAAALASFEADHTKLDQHYGEEHAEVERNHKASLANIIDKADANEKAARTALQEAIWLTETVFEATESQPIEQFQQARKAIEAQIEELQKYRDAAIALLKRTRMGAPAGAGSQSADAPPAVTPANAAVTGPQVVENQPGDSRPLADDPERGLHEQVEMGGAALRSLEALKLPRMFRSLWPFIVFVVLAAAPILLAAWRLDWRLNDQLMMAGYVSVGAALAIMAVGFFVARSRARARYRPLEQALAAAAPLAQACVKLAERHRDRQKAQLIEQRDRDVRLARERYEPVLAEIASRREHHLQRIAEKFPRMLKELTHQHETAVADLRERRDRRLAEIDQSRAQQLQEVRERFDRQTAENDSRYHAEWSALEHRWNQSIAIIYQTAAQLNRDDARLFPGWNDRAWEVWRPPHDFSPVIRFGSLAVDVSQLPGGLPKDERLKLPGPPAFTLPAMLAFPEPCSLLMQAGDHGRDAAVHSLQTVMFRLLTTLPPGKVRFTIIDPVGLGQNFAGFMHLADYEGAMVGDKIWTEDRHIDQRLADLTEHMENVIQKYLRNEYQTIGEYNRDAGEIAEPFRFLVIANFPVNFTESAARRLASIVASGPRCGVYTLITTDTRQALPQGFQLADLESHSVTIRFDDGGKPAWNDPDYARFPLSLDPPPAEDFVTHKLHLIGEAAKDSTRVEVPFDVVAPGPQQMWSGSTTDDLRVALGRCGATKLQYLTLGRGTSQHALVAGKTGSGKSTLMHALITNLALWYSPQEVEFYLVDFKKGVEFKTYATHDLPHARAVAIESDREFGLSVLQRLDAELKHRGHVFRELGVQDLAGYRRAVSSQRESAAFPRVLLIIDEFQELFTEDDKIGQDAALLLDRLVRQGRAFGMHVVLGSQTLGGAYSLARSTINQMAVRIALQCSEADSYLILSDDNAAARLLGRPGEAIYNDASGTVEGNSPFQVVWLPEEKRDACLNRVKAMARERRIYRLEPQIVFEGNVPADLARNHLLAALLAGDQWPLPTTSGGAAWLGEAIAIKDPTAATFTRQSGNNLLIVGQRDESALAMFASALISLAAQHPPTGAGSARFYVLDGTPVDSPTAGHLEGLASRLPHSVAGALRSVSYRDVPAAINEIAEELERREHSHASEAPAIYLFILGLQRYRMLRQEEDFGMPAFNADDSAAPRPEKQFGAILREGPVHGIHTLAWCDTTNNLSRALDRSSLKEFEIRVLFQMGATDSSNLIDSPAAARLGLHRALFYSEQHGQIEKFRPYALPDEAFVSHVIERLARRTGARSLAAPQPRS